MNTKGLKIGFIKVMFAVVMQIYSGFQANIPNTVEKYNKVFDPAVGMLKVQSEQLHLFCRKKYEGKRDDKPILPTAQSP